MLKRIKIEELTPFDKNPRVNDQAVDRVLESLKFNGYVSPIVVNEIGHPFDQHVIAAGHTRWKALKKFGSTDIDVYVHKFESEKHFVRFNIEDNKAGEFAEWDEQMLADLGAEFDVDLVEMGFDFEMPEEENEGLTDEDDVPETPEEPTAKLGQIWKLGDHRLMCGDSTDKDCIDKLLDGCVPDLVHTDPPYGIKESAKKRKSREANSLAKSNSHLPEFNDESVEQAQKSFEIVQELGVKNQVWWGANYYAHSCPETASWFVWDKRVEEKQKDMNSDCELAWVKAKWESVRIFRHLWKGLVKGSEHGESRVHPTQKPVALVEWVLDYFGGIGTVLDLFGGSGSTLIGAEKKGSSCYTMEFEPYYCDVIIKRWEDFTGKKAELINAI